MQQTVKALEQHKNSLEHQNSIQDQEIRKWKERDASWQSDRQGEGEKIRELESCLKEEAEKTRHAEAKCRDLESDVDELKQLLEEEQARVAHVCTCLCM